MKIGLEFGLLDYVVVFWLVLLFWIVFRIFMVVVGMCVFEKRIIKSNLSLDRK